MRLITILLRLVGGLLLALLLLLAVSLAPVDDTPYRQTAYYAQTKARLAQLPAPPRPMAPLRAGWAKVNLTTPYTTPTGGYGVRRGRHWTTVSDSVYARAIVLDNGATRVALVSLDLLITPPTVAEQLKKRLPEVGLRWESVFMGAIHTHNSLGAWAPRLAGSLFSGDFEPRVVDHITETVLRAIRQAQAGLAPVQVGYEQADAAGVLYNRLDAHYPVDGPIRLLKLTKPDGTAALLTTFAGHATVLDAKKSLQYLSRDYPGAFVDRLERETGAFAVFMAGAVGSMGPREQGTDDFDALRTYADTLVTLAQPALGRFRLRTDSTLVMQTLPLGLREPHARVIGNWRVRPWLFHSAYGDYPSDLKALRIGTTVLIGTPCDFSGELALPLVAYARRRGLNLMVTSFNGGYIGYVTPDQYYNKDAYETRTMNWFGPYNGAYFTELIQGLLEKV